MSPRNYVGGLPSPATDTRLSLHCVPHGKVRSACLIRRKINDRPCGYDFVEMGSGEEAGRVIMMLNGTDWKGRDSTCSPCWILLYSETGASFSGARPSEAQAGLSTVHPGKVGSFTVGILMLQGKALTARKSWDDNYALLNVSLRSLCVAVRNFPSTQLCLNLFAWIERAGGAAGECQGNL
jgi:hypothetical protein